MNLVRIHRQIQGMSQFDLGRKIGLDQSVISKVERGEIKLNSEKMSLIARTLGVSENVLFPQEK